LLVWLAIHWQSHARQAGCQEAAMIYKRGKRWRVIVYAGRDPITRRKRQKSVSVNTRAEAKQAEARLITEVGAGQHRATATRTVAELLDRWLEWRQSVRPISPTTLATYRGYIDRAIRPTLGMLQLSRLDAATLDAFYAHLRKQGGKNGRPMAASSVHQVHAILSGALNRAVVWGWIVSNPARLASPPSIERADMQPPPVEDAARLLRIALAEDPELGLFLRLAVVLGARRGELCAVRWSDVDLDQGDVLIAGGIVRVPGESLVDKATKTHAKRRVALGADTAELLRSHRIAQAKDALACGTMLAPDPYVFSHAPDGSAPINPDGITHRFRRLARRLGVRCRLHDLRHFMVTQLVAGGVDWRTIAGRAGHADGHMTLSTYAHFQEAQDRQAAEFMDRLLAAPGTTSR
jgi:integrase